MNLLAISALPTEENAAIVLHPDDTVAIARVHLAAGFTVVALGARVTARQPIPAGHKIAIRAMQAGDAVVRYGQRIGQASTRIEAGDWVHVQNVGYEEFSREFEFPEGEAGYPQLPDQVPTWMGYLREDGRAGTRNYLAVVAASNCAAHAAELAAASFPMEAMPDGVDGVVAFPHGEGCGMSAGPDLEQLQRTLGGVLNHPNIAGAVVVGLGCEVNQIDHYLGVGAARTGRLAGLTVQGSGGTKGTVEAIRRALRPMIERAAAEKRVAVPASKIVLGLNCGGSDSFSGITANPALGFCSDRLAAVHGTAVLAETTECFGAEHLLVRRARNREVAERFLFYLDQYRTYLRRFGAHTFDDNPSPGNKEGGLTNILEKSLGAAAKAGTTRLNEVVDYAEAIRGPGFVFMNTPGYDPMSLTGLVAGGCNLIAFTTGRGSAIGFPSVPVIKIATNTGTYERMRDNMDVNAGRIADGAATVQQVGEEIFELVLQVASGERTSAERMGHQEFVPWRIGPVL